MFAITIGMFVAFTFGMVLSLAEMGMEATEWKREYVSPLPIATKEEDEQYPYFELLPLNQEEGEENEVVVRLTPVVEERMYAPLPDIFPVEDETAELLLPKATPRRQFVWAEVVWDETDLLPKAMDPAVLHLLATGERSWMKKAESTLGNLLA